MVDTMCDTALLIDSVACESAARIGQPEVLPGPTSPTEKPLTIMDLDYCKNNYRKWMKHFCIFVNYKCVFKSARDNISPQIL